MRVLETRIPPLALTVAFGAAMYGVARAVPGPTFDVPARVAVAIGVAVAGGVIAFAGVATFRAHRTTMNPTTPGEASVIVTDGVYRYTRNPMYLGLLLVLAGWAVFLGNVVACLFLPAFVLAMHRLQILPEERAMESRFGGDYERYAARTRRWL